MVIHTKTKHIKKIGLNDHHQFSEYYEYVHTTFSCVVICSATARPPHARRRRRQVRSIHFACVFVLACCDCVLFVCVYMTYARSPPTGGKLAYSHTQTQTCMSFIHSTHKHTQTHTRESMTQFSQSSRETSGNRESNWNRWKPPSYACASAGERAHLHRYTQHTHSHKPSRQP